MTLRVLTEYPTQTVIDFNYGIASEIETLESLSNSVVPPKICSRLFEIFPEGCSVVAGSVFDNVELFSSVELKIKVMH
jgi:hypothetical protein